MGCCLSRKNFEILETLETLETIQEYQIFEESQEFQDFQESLKSPESHKKIDLANAMFKSIYYHKLEDLEKILQKYSPNELPNSIRICEIYLDLLIFAQNNIDFANRYVADFIAVLASEYCFDSKIYYFINNILPKLDLKKLQMGMGQACSKFNLEVMDDTICYCNCSNRRGLSNTFFVSQSFFIVEIVKLYPSVLKYVGKNRIHFSKIEEVKLIESYGYGSKIFRCKYLN